ncbi:MAG TPA: PEGA domain-containing protein, partial [Candidatus Deferrimicrobiaceae bacterium]
PDVPPENSIRFPPADAAALRNLAGKLSAVASRMETVEVTEAASLLDEAEREARGYRFDEGVRPYLSEIFLRKGTLKLWEGDPASAESFLARSRALRPGFSPDPALFPPQFLAAWQRASDRPPPEAELIVRTMPPGAQVFVDGENRGTTPSRVRIASPGPHTVRLAHPGYRDAEREGQWLPGDSGILDVTLRGDTAARLGEILGVPASGKESGAILAEIAALAGVRKIAIVLLEKGETGDSLRANLYARSSDGGDAVPLGVKELSAGEQSAEDAAKWAAARLAAAGWPPVPADRKKRPWYHTWWPWAAALVVIGVVVAAGAGGGGGGSGGSTGTVAVNF